ncbi:MAG: hypothetical protein ACON4H_14750 [Rubripirellula sp.]
MISSVAGVPYAASKGGTRDAADQEITDRVNAASELDNKSDRATEITESSATGDRNPDGRHPLDEFQRSNQDEVASDHKTVCDHANSPPISLDQTNDPLKPPGGAISQLTRAPAIQSLPSHKGNSQKRTQDNSISPSDSHQQQLDFSA